MFQGCKLHSEAHIVSERIYLPNDNRGSILRIVIMSVAVTLFTSGRVSPLRTEALSGRRIATLSLGLVFICTVRHDSSFHGVT
jgi:hypothetical protein